jgi:hypothetical protein
MSGVRVPDAAWIASPMSGAGGGGGSGWMRYRSGLAMAASSCQIRIRSCREIALGGGGQEPWAKKKPSCSTFRLRCSPRRFAVSSPVFALFAVDEDQNKQSPEVDRIADG